MSKPKKTTIDSLVKELELAREIATANGNTTAMISATMSKAKLLGLDKGIPESSNAQPVRITIHRVDARRYTDDDIVRQDDGSFFIKPIELKKS